MASLRRFIRETGAAVVNIHYGVNHVSLKDVLAVRLAGKRCVVSVHHAVPWADERSRKNTRLAANLSHAVIVTTDVMRDQLLEAGVAEKRIRVIPNGVPIPQRPVDKAEARVRLSIEPDAFVVASLSRLVPEKGIGDLVQAASELRGASGKLCLVIAGEGPSRQELETQAMNCLGVKARFLGRIDNPDILYAATDVFSLPSYEEGFGLVFVEAAFHGTPSVTTRVGGVPAVVVDGETGLLVQPGDVDSLRRCLQSLFDEPELRERLGAAARKRAYAEFTVGTMISRYESELLGGAKPAQYRLEPRSQS
jgi:glycosyltransferase involved in cell wall biosynthesis